MCSKGGRFCLVDSVPEDALELDEAGVKAEAACGSGVVTATAVTATGSPALPSRRRGAHRSGSAEPRALAHVSDDPGRHTRQLPRGRVEVHEAATRLGVAQAEVPRQVVAAPKYPTVACPPPPRTARSCTHTRSPALSLSVVLVSLFPHGVRCSTLCRFSPSAATHV